MIFSASINTKSNLSLTMGFVGFIDDYDETTKTVIDFKYSNNRSYLTSPQIHLYKYFGEQQGLEIDKLGFLFVPKVAIRQRKN